MPITSHSIARLSWANVISYSQIKPTNINRPAGAANVALTPDKLVGSAHLHAWFMKAELIGTLVLGNGRDALDKIYDYS